MNINNDLMQNANLDLLRNADERGLIKQLLDFPGIVDNAASNRAPHLICDYLERTSGLVNSWYHSGNPNRNPELAVLVEDVDVKRARLVLAQAIRVVLRNGLEILGISAPEYMAREIEDDD
jgi:arginyl-tRNA synthetase